MAQYKELLAQKQELDRRIEAARRAEAAVELEAVRKSVAQFGFTPEQVFGKRSKGTRTPATPKYLDPVAGKTWSGRGRPPLWLAGQDIEHFRVVP